MMIKDSYTPDLNPGPLRMRGVTLRSKEWWNKKGLLFSNPSQAFAWLHIPTAKLKILDYWVTTADSHLFPVWEQGTVIAFQQMFR